MEGVDDPGKQIIVQVAGEIYRSVSIHGQDLWKMKISPIRIPWRPVVTCMSYRVVGVETGLEAGDIDEYYKYVVVITWLWRSPTAEDLDNY